MKVALLSGVQPGAQASSALKRSSPAVATRSRGRSARAVQVNQAADYDASYSRHVTAGTVTMNVQAKRPSFSYWPTTWLPRRNRRRCNGCTLY
jgi:hypothetical protein